MRIVPLKTKLVSLLIVGGIFLCLLVGFTTYFYLNSTLQNENQKQVESLNIEQGHELFQIFENNALFAKMLGTRTRVTEYLLDRTEPRREELLNIFLDYAQTDSEILSLYLLDETGKTLISTDPSFVGGNYSFREYFKQSIMGIPHVDMLLGKTSNELGYYFSHPVLNKDKKVIGVFVSKISGNKINTALSFSELRKNSKIMLTDAFGVIISNTMPDRFLKSLGQLTAKEEAIINSSQKFLNKKITALQYDSALDTIRNKHINQIVKYNDKIDGEIEFLNVIKIEKYPFYLVSEIGTESISATIYSTISLLIILIFFSIFLVSYALFKMISIFTQPMTALIAFAKKISQGTFNQTIKIKRRDEFGQLSDAFNTMSNNLNDLYKNLDEKIIEKTQVLENKQIEVENQKKALLNVLEDMGKEKNISDELATIVRSANEPIISIDLNNIITSWNDGAELVYGYSASEMIGQPIKIIIPKEELPETAKLYNNLLSGKSLKHIQTKRKRKDGTLVAVLISGSPIKDVSGKVVGASMITTDISKEALIDKAKTEFVSLASHQLRTPLSAINWYTEMLLAGDAGKINKQQKEFLNEIYRGNQRMVELVNALLNVSRLELGTFLVEPKEVDIRTIADSAISDLKPQVISKHIIFTKNYDPKIKIMMLDEKLTTIIFQNLLSNAVKYTPDGGKVNLDITVGKKDLTIAISDTGLGVPKGQQNKIFEKLFRADNVRQTSTEGTGLGLYLVKSIMEATGGSVSFKSEENKGSTFFITIPLGGMKKKEGTKALA